MTNTKTKFTDLLIVRVLVGIAIVSILLVLPRIPAVFATATAAQCPAGAHQTAGECTPDVAPVAEGTDTTAEDVAAEGTDVLPVSFHAAPADLWDALHDQHPAAYSDDVPGIGTFWVEVGTVVNVPGGLYLATLDGWMGCADGITLDGECSATGPVLPLDIEPVPASVIYGADELAQCSTDAQCAALDADRALAGLDELDGPAYGTEQDGSQVLNVAHVTRIGDAGDRRQMCKAARLIHNRLDSGRLIFEDYTWRGMPRVVAAQNDAVLDAMERDGLRGNDWPFSKRAHKWLARFTKGCGGTDHVVRA